MDLEEVTAASAARTAASPYKDVLVRNGDRIRQPAGRAEEGVDDHDRLGMERPLPKPAQKAAAPPLPDDVTFLLFGPTVKATNLTGAPKSVTLKSSADVGGAVLRKRQHSESTFDVPAGRRARQKCEKSIPPCFGSPGEQGVAMNFPGPPNATTGASASLDTMTHMGPDGVFPMTAASQQKRFQKGMFQRLPVMTAGACLRNRSLFDLERRHAALRAAIINAERKVLLRLRAEADEARHAALEAESSGIVGERLWRKQNSEAQTLLWGLGGTDSAGAERLLSQANEVLPRRLMQSPPAVSVGNAMENIKQGLIIPEHSLDKPSELQQQNVQQRCGTPENAEQRPLFSRLVSSFGVGNSAAAMTAVDRLALTTSVAVALSPNSTVAPTTLVGNQESKRAACAERPVPTPDMVISDEVYVSKKSAGPRVDHDLEATLATLDKELARIPYDELVAYVEARHKCPELIGLNYEEAVFSTREERDNVMQQCIETSKPKNAEKGSKNVSGRKGDKRMNKAVLHKLENPEVSYMDALLLGGFVFPKFGQPLKEKELLDTENVTLCQRKNQLRRRIRFLEGKEKSAGREVFPAMHKRTLHTQGKCRTF